jgi:hypothetical protein
MARNIPQDIKEAFSLLSLMKNDLSDCMACDIEEPMDILREQVSKWADGGKEPNWDSFRDAINAACIEDGMPRLF